MSCVVTNMTHLCSLNLFRVENIPSAIGKLKHLRFIDLSHTFITLLPNSITSLYNLHTLKISLCPTLVKLPEGMGDMV